MDTTEDRFWLKVDRRGKDECWNWIGGIGSKGYGVFTLNGKPISAHRFSYQLKTGDLPKDLLICHTCDNPKCVNPSHLFSGTNADNARDKTAKHRNNSPKGERHGRSKLTESQVIEIRQLTKTQSLKTIAGKFGISFKHVSAIANFRKWAWLKGE